ncbi:ribose-phosphate pyrophosphokinase-like domain-containing protein [Nocardia sp. NPDC004582]
MLERFPDGEIRPIVGHVSGQDVYVVQSTAPPVNDNFVELLLLLDACRRSRAAHRRRGRRNAWPISPERRRPCLLGTALIGAFRSAGQEFRSAGQEEVWVGWAGRPRAERSQARARSVAVTTPASRPEGCTTAMASRSGRSTIRAITSLRGASSPAIAAGCRGRASPDTRRPGWTAVRGRSRSVQARPGQDGAGSAVGVDDGEDAVMGVDDVRAEQLCHGVIGGDRDRVWGHDLADRGVAQAVSQTREHQFTVGGGVEEPAQQHQP